MKNKSLSFLIVFLFLLTFKNAFGQAVDTTLSAANTSGNVTATHSITLANGFSASGANGAFSAKIVAPTVQCVTMNIAPSPSQNYIVTYTPRVEGVSNPADPNNTTCQVMASIQYIDGLGRPLQTVQVKASPKFRDIVQPIAYDQFGREAVKYNPYTIAPSIPSVGAFQPNAVVDQASFYNPANATVWNAPGIMKTYFPVAETSFEPSPLNRVMEQGAAGDNWQLTGKAGANNPGHTTKIVYATNDAPSINSGSGHWAKQYGVTLDANGKPSLADQGSYGPNQLYVTVTYDENWKSTDGKAGTTEDYTDKENHLILKRVFNTSNEILSTYYVYDDFGNLTYALPPKAEPDNGGITQATLDALCFQYRYDERQRAVEKKIPGKGREFIVFNKLNQVVATQDSMQRVSGKWAFIKYDALGRIVITGFWNNGGANVDRVTLQGTVNNYTNLWESRDNNSSINKYYTATAFPNSNIGDYLKINYYDDYTIPGLPVSYDKHVSYSQMTRSLLTASLTNVLGTNDMLWSVKYYDDKGRVVDAVDQHYLGGTLNVANYDETNNHYNFTDNIVASHRNHYAAGNPVLAVVDSVVYDHIGRKIQQWNQINGSTQVLLVQNSYNEIGQQSGKHLHSTDQGISFLQDVTFKYNERGWMTRDSAALFDMQFLYNDGTSPQFNGNIANVYWGTGNNLTKNYSYTYDKINRLLSGVSNEGFTENNMVYDKGGNLQSLSRQDPRTASTYNISFGYSGNQLNTIAGLTTVGSYQYDGNGNTRTDALNNVTISYNTLGLPQKISGSKIITYTYDAGGSKLRRVSSNSSVGTDDYINGIQYHNGVVDFITTVEGKVRRDAGTGSYSYEYSLVDQLGNNRVNFDNYNNAARTIQQDDYYPFGLNYNRYSYGEKNNYLYNKKELQQEMTQYDYGSRFYDPNTARFTSIDTYSEKYFPLNPYHYSSNNPINLVDMKGDSVIVSANITNDKSQNQAFNDFATSKEGKKFLANYAAKGQTIAGVTYGKDGKYNAKGIDLKYDAKDLGDESRRGETGSKEPKETGNGRAQIEVDVNKKNATGFTSFKDITFSRTITYFHESLIHADLDTKDYLDNGHFDYSNISTGAKNDAKYPVHYQHYQVINDYRDKGFNTQNLWPMNAFYGLREVNGKRNEYQSEKKMFQQMWNYVGGLKIDDNGKIK